MNEPDILDTLHMEGLCEPRQWVQTAERLMEVAGLLRPKVDLYWNSSPPEKDKLDPFVSVYMMLCGFAVENLLKAIIMQDGGALLRQELLATKRLPQVMNTHDLRKLCQSARIRIEPPEIGMLVDQLTRAAEWTGRYPMPTTPGKIAAQNIFNLDPRLYVATKIESPSDARAIDDIVATLKKVLHTRSSQKETTVAQSP